jgi:membrane-anchored mycosin MYCP
VLCDSRRLRQISVLLSAAFVLCFAGMPVARAGLPSGTYCSLPGTGQYTPRPWTQQLLDFERVWPISRGGGVTVAVVDSGVDANQPYLAGHVLPGIDLVNGGTADDDCAGHGTLVAGLIASQPRPGVGFAGVAPDATILPVRQVNQATDNGSTQILADSINAAVNAGAQVINVSIVTSSSTAALAAAVNNALAHNVVVVAAAGNDLQKGDLPEYPAAYPGVISVGAIGTDGRATNFSSTGTPVSVVAPGSEIVGPGAGGTGLVVGQQGTSYAAPFVAGVAALIHAYRPQLTPAQVLHRIEATADHPAGALPDAALGYGVVDPYAAVTAVLPEENGAKVAVQPVAKAVPSNPPPVNDATTMAALGLAGAAAAIVVVLPLVALTVRRIRTRAAPN